jgi:transcriptional regulator with XRE-family HTH domain
MPAWVVHPSHRAVIDALIKARRAAGMTQRDVASKLGKPPSFVAKVESIERNLSILEYMAWTRVLGVDPGKILASAIKGLRADGQI